MFGFTIIFESDVVGVRSGAHLNGESVGDGLLLERKLLWSTRAKIDVQLAPRIWVRFNGGLGKSCVGACENSPLPSAVCWEPDKVVGGFSFFVWHAVAHRSPRRTE